MRIKISLLFFCVASVLNAQSIEKSSIDAGGAVATNSDVSMVYTIGEVFVNESSNSNIYVSEGFISSNILKPTLTTTTFNSTHIKVFPNPVSEKLFFSDNNNKINRLEIYDINGKRILIKENNLKELEVRHLKKAMYLLKVFTEKGVSTFKILKK